MRRLLSQGYELKDFVNPKIFKWTQDNYNNILNQSEMPRCIRDARLTEIFACCPFS